MPHGISGLLIAAILAAAMSNLSAALNSLSSSSIVDFYLRRHPETSDRERLRLSRISTLLWALVLFALAMLSRNIKVVVEVGLAIASVAYGALLGVFRAGRPDQAGQRTRRHGGLFLRLRLQPLSLAGAAVVGGGFAPHRFLAGAAARRRAVHLVRCAGFGADLRRRICGQPAVRAREPEDGRACLRRRRTGKRRELARDLKVSHAGAIVVGTIIGSGIFLVPAEMMQAVGSAGMVYLAWIVGGLLSMFGALTYSELAAMKPQAGGEYVYMRDGYGPLGGFLYAWTYFVIAKPGSMASIVTGLVRILSNLSALQFLGETRIDGWHPTHSGQAVAIGAIVLISFINYIGVKKAGEFQLFFTLLKVALILAIVAMGFAYADGSLANFATSYSLARGGMAGFMAALLASLWAYDGWNLVTTVSARDSRPATQLAARLDCRCGNGGRVVHPGERGGAVRDPGGDALPAPAARRWTRSDGPDMAS